MKLIVVICHFKENLDWVKNLKYPYLVCNKNPKQNDKFEFNMPNEGYDVAAYLTYIINNYDTLPNFVCFSQDNPFAHCSNFLDLVNGFNFETEFLPLGTTYIRDNNQILSSTIKYAEENGIQYTLPIKFTSGCQYIISKTMILKNPREFYEKILKTVMLGTVITNVNYTLEYLFPTIFHFNSDLKTTYK